MFINLIPSYNHLNNATVSIRSRNWQEAVSHLNAALCSFDKLNNTRSIQAIAFRLLMKVSRPKKIRKVDLYYQLAMSYRKNKQVQLAERTLKIALDRYPTSTRLLKEYVLISINLRNWAVAFSSLERLRDLKYRRAKWLNIQFQKVQAKLEAEHRIKNLVQAGGKKNSLPIYSGGFAPIWTCRDEECFRNIRQFHQNLLRQACHERNIKVWQRKSGFIWYALANSHGTRFRMSMPELTSSETRKLTNNKEVTKQILKASSIRVPEGKLFGGHQKNEAMDWYQQKLIKKAVVKPIFGSGGQGITAGIESLEELELALSKVKGRFLIEEHIDGDDHRLLVIGGKFVAGMRRVPANVVGDGVHSIRDLVNIKNQIRKNNPHTGKNLIKISETDRFNLSKIGFTEDSIIPFGQRVIFHPVANIGSGGDSEDLTEVVHPDFAKIAEQVWEAFPDLAYCGVDLIAGDITKPVAGQDYVVIEVNANSDIGFHHFPTVGKARNVAGVLIDYLFPDQKECLSGIQPESIDLAIEGKFVSPDFSQWLYQQAVLRSIQLKVVEFTNERFQVSLKGWPNAIDNLIGQVVSEDHGSLVQEIKVL